MKAKRLIFDNNLMGYRLYTDFKIGTVDVNISSYNEYKMQFDIIGDIYLKKDMSNLVSDDEESSGNLVKDISNEYDICDALGLITRKTYARDVIGIVCTGETLKDELDKIKDYNKRYCFSDLMQSFDSSRNITIVYGVRRTGKTVLILQAIVELLKKGVSPSKILYCSVEQGVEFGDIDEFLITAADRLGIDYLFVDEFTYISFEPNGRYKQGNLGVYSESFVGKHFIFSGTNSSFFIALENGIWYDRFSKVNTSYISYKEFEHLYQNSTLKEYINAGGLLLDPVDLHSNIARHLKEYVNTAIIDNLFHAFDNTRLGVSDNFMSMREAYFSDKKSMRSFMYKCVQRYASLISVDIVNSILSSDDIGNASDLTFRGYKGKQRRDAREFCKRLENRFFDLYNFAEFNYSRECVDEVRSFLNILGCLITCDLDDSEVDFVVPVALRYGCTMDTVRLLSNEFDRLSDGLNLYVDKSLFAKKMRGVVSGVLFESIIYCDLYRSGVKFRKYRLHDRKEIDLVIDHDLYEIKMSSDRNVFQLKWLFDREIWDNLKPSSLNVIYSGVSCTEYHSRIDILNSIVEQKRVSSGSLDKPIEVIVPDYKFQVSDASAKKVVPVNYINVEEFLKRDSFKEGVSYESV